MSLGSSVFLVALYPSSSSVDTFNAVAIGGENIARGANGLGLVIGDKISFYTYFFR